MYAPPRDIEAEVFTTIPERFHHRGEPVAWVKALGRGDLHSFLEGPSFDAAGNLYCVDIPYGRIFRIDPAGEWLLVTQYDGLPTGLKIDADGRIIIADARKGLMQLDPVSGTPSSLVDSYNGEPFQGLNDLHIASNGDIFFTDPGRSHLINPCGRVFCLRNDGALELLLSGIPFPNGLVLNQAETHLFVAATFGNAIWRFAAGRRLEDRTPGLFIQLSGGHSGPDGMARDRDGNIAIAHAQHGTVWLFSPRGEPLLRLHSPRGIGVTNVAYGGRKGDILYVTEAQTGSILRARFVTGE